MNGDWAKRFELSRHAAMQDDHPGTSKLRVASAGGGKAGESAGMRSIFLNGIKHLPVDFTASRDTGRELSQTQLAQR